MPEAVPHVAVFAAVVLCAVPAVATGEEDAEAPHRAGEVELTISTETTYIEDPVRPDGTIDWAAAYNERFGEGVTPENNAYVLLLRVFGVEHIDERRRAAVCEAIGRPDLVDAPGVYIGPHAFAESLHFEDTREALDFAKQLEAARDELAGLSGPEETPRADRGELARWLEANKEALDLLVEASERPRSFRPWVAVDEPGLTDGSLWWLGVSLRVSDGVRALVARAAFRREAGDIEEAMADLLAVHKLSRLNMQGATLVDALVAMALEHLAWQGNTALIRSGYLSAEEARAYRRQLDATDEIPSLADVCERGERMWGLRFLTLAARHGLNTVLPAWGGSISSLPEVELDWDIVFRAANTRIDEVVTLARLEDVAVRKERQAELAEAADMRLAEFLGRVPKDDPVGRKALAEVIEKVGTENKAKLSHAVAAAIALEPASLGACDIRDRAAMEFQLTRVGLALVEYERETGAYPPKLAILTPKYLTAVPVDVFSGEPLRYRRTGEGFVLYSMGLNLEDDGGTAGKGMDRGDIVLRVGEAD